jgi:hypothetical protein
VFGGGRLQDDCRTDDRRIEIAFKHCYYTRTGHHSDTEGVEAVGYEVAGGFGGDMRNYLSWRCDVWRRDGLCPDSGFYVAQESSWLPKLPGYFQQGYRHYVVDGRDGYVELIAKSFAWREWLWGGGQREDVVLRGLVVGQGEGVA